MSPPKTVLITGTSAGGIGSALAIAFQKRGYHVFAAARNPSKAEHLAELPNVETIELDVTSASSVSQAVRTMETKLAGRGLDVLVNNAGVSMTMPLADVDLDAGRALFEVNFWGVLKMAQALLPLLILARGTVVNVSSTGGEMHTPWLGEWLVLLRLRNTCPRKLEELRLSDRIPRHIQCVQGGDHLRLRDAPFGARPHRRQCCDRHDRTRGNENLCQWPGSGPASWVAVPPGAIQA